jgi:peptidyl-prolyl cis-trans isomerase SurA
MALANRNRSTSIVVQARLLAAALIIASCGSAMAQHVVVFVNGDPITAIDIEQRIKFNALSGGKPAPRQKVLDELIDEKLKVREGHRWGINVSDADVNNSFATMARRMNRSTEQLTQDLAQKGIKPNTLKTRIRADIVWQQLVRGRYQSRLPVSDREVVSLLESQNLEDTLGYDYTLRPILFLIPPGAPASTYEARRKQADALRKSFKGCVESIPAVRAMPNVVARDQVIRSSADIPEALRKMLDSVPLGQLTAPEVTRHGIEMFAVCAKIASKGDSPLRKKTREALMSKRFEQESNRYLRLLRRNALIEPGK